MSELAEHFVRFADLFQEPILLVSSSGHLCAANRAAREQLLHDATFTPDDELTRFMEEDPAKLTPYLRECSRSAQPLPGLFRFRAPAGQFRCQGSAFRARDDQQRPLVVLRFAPKDVSTNRFAALTLQIGQLRNEIARRVNAERTAEGQRRLWQVTLSSIGDAVITTDINGRITFINPVAEEHLACSFDECSGKSLEQVFVIRDERTGEQIENPVQAVLRTGRVVALANQAVLLLLSPRLQK